MTDPNPPAQGSDPSGEKLQRAVERAEAAATRRRWVTLAEVVGVAGLLIAALSLWMSWSDRRADEADRRQERASESRTRSLVMLTASAEHGGARLALTDSAHPIQSVDIRFPASFGVTPQNSVLEPHIDADWIARPLLAATDNGPDEQQGRLPAIITSSYWDGDRQIQDSAIYDILWRTEGRLLRGRKLVLQGMILRERSGSAKRLEAIWARERPKGA